MLIYGIIALSILVFVHELGHFLLAKWNGVGVLEFAIGFGKKIWKKRIGDTTYSVGIIPLGGYVRMVGDDPRLLDKSVSGPNPSDLIEGTSQELTPEEQALLKDESKWFLNKGYWAKSSIVIAGPAFNILFAIILAFGLHYIYGRPDPETQDKPIIGELVPGYPAEKAGLQRQDYVRSIDGKELHTWMDLALTVAHSGGKEMTLLVERKDKEGRPLPPFEVKVTGTFENQELTALDDEAEKLATSESGDTPPKEEILPKDRAMIGISPFYDRVPVSFMEAAELAPQYVWFISKMSVKSIFAIFEGKISPKNIGGPIYIFSEAGRSAKSGWDYLINFMILISVSLAIFNLLPIPVLDGGHLLFFTLGALLGGRLSVRVQQRASQVGMVFILALMLFALTNDIVRTVKSWL